MEHRDIVVIGASAGGLEALQTLLSGLERALPAVIFVVLHISPDYPSYLPEILSGAGPLKVEEPRDGEDFLRGHVYVAPRDNHLLVEQGHVVIAHGPKENRSRPSIDALFRSAAYAYRTRVIGTVLSGRLDDGVAGLWSIKRAGGLAIVQAPDDAKAPSMPLNALAQVEVDYVLPAAKMGGLLRKLVRQPAATRRPMDQVEENRLGVEVSIAGNRYTLDEGMADLGEATRLTCPECRDALTKIKQGPITRFRCHTGHASSPEALLAGIDEEVDRSVFQAGRTLQDSALLLEELGQCFVAEEKREIAERFFAKAQAAKEKAQVLRTLENSEARAG